MEPPIWATRFNSHGPRHGVRNDGSEVARVVFRGDSHRATPPTHDPNSEQPRQQPNGQTENSVRPPPQAPPSNHPLGAWEPTITNEKTLDGMTRAMMDFMFVNVVNREDFETGAAGGLPSRSGQLEIEAKIGKLIDNRTGQRVRMPVIVEAALDPNLDLKFESSMTIVSQSFIN